MNIKLMISLALIVAIIYQSIQIKRLKKQTIETFKKLCEKVFEDIKNDIRW